MNQTRELLAQYLDLKNREDKLKFERQKLATKIAALLPHPEEGSKTHTVDEFKVTVGQRINRKVDWEQWDKILVLHSKCHAPEKTKRELDVKGLHWIQKNQPEFYKALAKAIVAKPGIPSVAIKKTK